MTDHQEGILLPGLDGANPLGFLAALGTLQVLTEANPSQTVALSWTDHACTWTPLIRGAGRDASSVSEALAQQLKCPFQPNQQALQKCDRRRGAHHEEKKKLKDAIESLKKRNLRGKERQDAEVKELDPMRRRLAKLRVLWLQTLRQVVPSPELALGEHLNASCDELREQMLTALDTASEGDRTAVDLFASFGSDACKHPKSDTMQATGFCFITGSGHQYFLGTVRKLMEEVNAGRLKEALFTRTEHSDETLSMRWDPGEDRRYAVMWSDPGKVDKPRTNWALNLLGYRGLQSLPSVPRSTALATTGWLFDSKHVWRWPIWGQELSVHVVRSLLSHPLCVSNNSSDTELGALGVVALYEVSRIQVGNPPLHKVNFTPAHRIA